MGDNLLQMALICQIICFGFGSAYSFLHSDRHCLAHILVSVGQYCPLTRLKLKSLKLQPVTWYDLNCLPKSSCGRYNSLVRGFVRPNRCSADSLMIIADESVAILSEKFLPDSSRHTQCRDIILIHVPKLREGALLRIHTMVLKYRAHYSCQPVVQQAYNRS